MAKSTEIKSVKIKSNGMNCIEDNMLCQLQQLARDSVIEPFEGRKGIETIQKTRGKLDQGVSSIKKASVSAGKWFSNTSVVNKSKTKINEFVADTKEKHQHGTVSSLLSYLDNATEELQLISKQVYENVEEKVKALTVSYIKRGLEILIHEDTEAWIIPRANKILNRNNLTELSQIQALSTEDRNILIDQLYPYDNPSLKTLSKGFDVSLNVGLGAIVVTNLPGTGILVSFVNMGKTIVKLGNRINIMSAVHGYEIDNPQALYKICADILNSLEDWENNPDHKPLDPGILNYLYAKDNNLEKGSLKELMNVVAKKEAYIAIPGIGMISLGKINLDDLKLDLVVKNLVQNYFSRNKLIQRLGEKKVDLIVKDFKKIYSGFFSHDYFKTMRKKLETESLNKSDSKWKTRLKLFAGINKILENASLNLDIFADSIFRQISFIDEKDKEKIIAEEINIILQNVG